MRLVTLHIIPTNDATAEESHGFVVELNKKGQIAEDKIAECFPGREIFSVTCKDLVMEGGGLHCIAMHQPK